MQKILENDKKIPKNFIKKLALKHVFDNNT